MTVLFRALAATAFILWAGLALAQTDAAPDYEAWTSLANRAEEVVEAGRASDEALEILRAEVAGWRERFLTAQGSNSSRVQTLQAQLDALGPAPEDGSAEVDGIAERRQELTAQLSALRAPQQRAEEAYTRANGIVGEIDDIIRDRQTDALLELGPSPLNPVHWAPALEDLSSALSRSWKELRNNAASDILRIEAWANLPLIVLQLAIGLMLLARGQRWARAAVNQLRGRTQRGMGVWRFLVSLGQIILPLAGIYALSEAAFATGMIGPRWALLLQQVPFWASVLLGIRWLADQCFNENDDVAALPLEPADRAAARALANVLAVLYVLRDVLEAVIRLDGFAEVTVAVANFPLLVLSGLMLYRLGRVRNKAAMADIAAAELPGPGHFRLRFARLIARAVMIVGVVGPVMAAIGFAGVGEGLVYPAIETLALIGLLLVLQELLKQLYNLFTGNHPDEDETLLPVLAGFVLSLAALPALALIWGARVADLTELWTRFKEGFVIGETRFSPTDFLVVIVVFIVGYMLTRLLQGALRTSVLPKTRIDQGGQNAIVSGIGYVGVFVAAIVAITAGGLDLSSLAILAGALSVGIGFGLQNIVSNFVSGIILLIERPISEGDWIEVGGLHGIVKDISVRSTRIETFDRYDVIIPNADFVSGQVSNYTRGNVLGRVIVPVGVAYGSNTRKVERILLNIAREHDMVLMNPAPAVDFTGFGADSLDFRIRAVVRDVNHGLAVQTEMRHQIVERFAEEGIEIPFAQRDVWLRNPEVLTGRARPEHVDGKDKDGAGDAPGRAREGRG